MNRYFLLIVMALSTSLIHRAGASIRSSNTYSIPAEGIDGGGALSGSAHYSHSGSIGGMIGTASSASYSSSTGVLHQTANTPPEVAPYAVATAYQTPATIYLSKILTGASDADGDIVSVSAVDALSSNNGVVSLQTTEIVYTPPSGFSGVDSFQFTVNDGKSGESFGTVSVTVGSPPDTGGQGSNAPTVTMSGSVPQVRFRAIPGTAYLLQRSINSMTSWQDVGVLTAGPTGIIEWSETEIPPPSSAFYRFRKP